MIDQTSETAMLVSDSEDVGRVEKGSGRTARERERSSPMEGLTAPQYLPNAYNQKFMRTNAQFYEGSCVFTFFTPFEVKNQPPGLKLFLKWAKKSGSPQNENSLAGWINADLFYQGLKAAGPDFTRQKVMNAINKMTDYTAGGILGGVNWQIQHTGENPLTCQVISKGPQRNVRTVLRHRYPTVRLLSSPSRPSPRRTHAQINRPARSRT
jgi:branched-chain amino acid transport system substrate-binding protein